MNEINDTELARNIKVGCEQSFRELYDRYHVQMYFIAKKYVKDPALAEDAVQDIFVKLWVKRAKLDENKSVKGFLFIMLKNHLLNTLRKRKKVIASALNENLELLPKKNLTEDELLYKEYHEIVGKGLNELSARKREVFELKAIGYSNPEVAKKLNINIRTVKTHYYNSSKFIRAYLKSHAGISAILIGVMILIFY